MTELGQLRINSPQSMKEARRKILNLAKALEFNAFHSTRLATVFSELIHNGYSTKLDININVGLKRRSGKKGLHLDITFPQHARPGAHALNFFDHYHVDATDNTSTCVRVFKFLDDAETEFTQTLIENQRQILAKLTREEMFEDLQNKTRELIVSSKETQKAREAAEKASEALKEQVKELDNSRRATLNILEDLSIAKAATEEAYKVITSSIHYATNIQRSILPPRESLDEIIPNRFVLWKPRDGVGGDVYFCKPWVPGRMVALGDCTGHGVPGAFMTLIANGALDIVLLETPPGDAAALLTNTHAWIQAGLRQDQDDGDSDDGLEMGVCYKLPDSNKLMYAGARFSLFYLDDGKVYEVRGDKKGLGYRGIPKDFSFTNHEVDIKPGRSFFMTSDGLLDQIGGPKRRGFGKKRFTKLLLEIQDVPMSQKGDHIYKALQEYQGVQKRRDDVSVIGFVFE